MAKVQFIYLHRCKTVVVSYLHVIISSDALTHRL